MQEMKLFQHLSMSVFHSCSEMFKLLIKNGYQFSKLVIKIKIGPGNCVRFGLTMLMDCVKHSFSNKAQCEGARMVLMDLKELKKCRCTLSFSRKMFTLFSTGRHTNKSKICHLHCNLAARNVRLARLNKFTDIRARRTSSTVKD